MNEEKRLTNRTFSVENKNKTKIKKKTTVVRQTNNSLDYSFTFFLKIKEQDE